MFVVDVSALTDEGFVGRSAYEGRGVNLRFDDSSAGVYLTKEMAARLHLRKGSRVVLTVEGDPVQVVEAVVAGLGGPPRISDPRVYYAVGREGGAVVHIRKS